jgi:hypothetical protein
MLTPFFDSLLKGPDIECEDFRFSFVGLHIECEDFCCPFAPAQIDREDLHFLCAVVQIG